MSFLLHRFELLTRMVKRIIGLNFTVSSTEEILHNVSTLPWLTIHESVGHPTELDRALGYEANYAGTSFLTVDKMGKLKFGSDIVNFVADKTIDNGLATCGYDDDGVKTTEWHLVKDGIFIDYQTTRDQVHWDEYLNAR